MEVIYRGISGQEKPGLLRRLVLWVGRAGVLHGETLRR